MKLNELHSDVVWFVLIHFVETMQLFVSSRHWLG